MAATAEEREVLMAQEPMCNLTDMQDKYCGHFYDLHPIQSQRQRWTRLAATTNEVELLSA